MVEERKKLYIQTFGCQMNSADSDEMFLVLSQYGYSLAQDIEEADTVIINTCTVREHAEQRALSLLGRLKYWKKRGSERKIIVAGCAAQRLGKTLKSRFPHVDIVAGAKAIEKFEDLIAPIVNAKASPSGEPGKAPLISYCTIMRGCSHACAYCIVPFVRGPGASRPPEEILAEIRAKAERGTREIMLLGQTVNSYRYNNEMNFSALLKAVHEIEGIKRIRYVSPHPSYINEDFARTLADYPKIARHMHLPVQSGSDRILGLMRRGYSRETLLEKIGLLKKAVPDIAVSTDFIVGFPTETESEFSETLSLVKECGFSSAYCFKYSPRAGTESAKMPDTVTREVMEERLGRLLEAVKETAAANLARLADTTQEVLFETEHKGRISSGYWAVSKTPQEPGSLKTLKITGRDENTLLV
ncbi:MAG: tRNA (N6-isopentenyl adenosine(37)-C2)-methylthiotransferase MiaB [Elusimicrobiaceae bacterium]